MVQCRALAGSGWCLQPQQGVEAHIESCPQARSWVIPRLVAHPQLLDLHYLHLSLFPVGWWWGTYWAPLPAEGRQSHAAAHSFLLCLHVEKQSEVSSPAPQRRGGSSLHRLLLPALSFLQDTSAMLLGAFSFPWGRFWL